MFDLNPEAATLAKARVLGIVLPDWRMHEYPALFSAWADLVAQADIARARNQLTDEMLDACDKQLGIPASRVRKADVVVYRAPGFAAAFAADPIGAIAKAVGAFRGSEDAGAAS